MRKKTRSSWKKKQAEAQLNTQNETEVPTEVNTQNQIIDDKNDSDDKTDKTDKTAGECENNTLIKSNTEESSEVVPENNKEDVVDQNLQGKSTGLNLDQSSNNIDNQSEIENDNVQGSAPSPKTNDENVQKLNDNTVTNEGNEEVTNESAPAFESKLKDESEQEDNKQNLNKEVFQSEYINENNIHNKKNEDLENIERSHTPELKPENKIQEKKRIILKRDPTQKSRRASSPLEDGEIKEPQGKSKKIMLKRRTTEDSSSDYIDKIVINSRPTGGDDKSEKRRLSGEEKTHVVVARPMKPAKPVKLKRHLSSLETEADLIPLRSRKTPWGESDWLKNLSASMYKIDVDSIKIICPAVEFLNESEVTLESTPKEHTKFESDAKKNILEDKTEDESEKEQSDEEDSTEEQKIEANPNIIALNRKISIVEDTAAKLKPPPSPAKNLPSEILYITNLVRPFTLKQLRELLERTGKIKEDGFWTDRIKSKCFVEYETVDEAETTRNALHGVYWPVGNVKQLVIEYATKEEMEKSKNPVPLPIAITEKLPEKEKREPEAIEVRRREQDREQDVEDKKREPSDREWNKSREDHRKRHSRSRSKSRERDRKHSRRSYTPEVIDFNRKKHKKSEDFVPQKLMDDLFLKTKTTPSIYWQPLSPQEIATKQQQRLVRMEEHKRRIEENRGRFRERDRRGTFRRR